jgi:glutaminyl-tRNA synthetase
VSVTKHPVSGAVTELHCTYDPDTKSGSPQAHRKVKATIHWVSASHAAKAEVRLYNQLFASDPAKISRDDDWTRHLSQQSIERLDGCLVEPSLGGARAGARFQFERQGYFCVDPDSSTGNPVFNRTVSLKDSWAKIDKSRPQR